MSSGSMVEIAMGIMAFAAVIVGIIQLRSAASESRNKEIYLKWGMLQHREEQTLQHMRRRLDRLCLLRAILQLDGWAGGNPRNREPAYGEAYSIIRTLPNKRLRSRAEAVLHSPSYTSRNAVVDDAIVWLGSHIRSFETQISTESDRA